MLDNELIVDKKYVSYAIAGKSALYETVEKRFLEIVPDVVKEYARAIDRPILTNFSGKQRDISAAARRNLGDSLILALHLESAPFDVLSEERQYKPHFSASYSRNGVKIEPNLRGSNLPSVAIKFC